MKFPWKKVRTVVLAPVTVPTKAIKRGVEKKIQMKVAISILRHVLTAAGGATVMTGDETEQVIGAIVTIATIGWSAFEKYRATRPDAPPAAK